MEKEPPPNLVESVGESVSTEKAEGQEGAYFEHLKQLGAHERNEELSQLAFIVEKMLPGHLLEAPNERFRRERAAVLELDLVGFTEITELLSRGRNKEKGARQVNEIMRQVYGTFERDLRVLGGEVIAYNGDAATIAFRGENQAERAAQAAVTAVRLVGELSSVKVDSETRPLSLSGGLSSGEICWGVLPINDNSGRKLSYLLGEAVSRAKALEESAGHFHIVVDEAIAEALPAESLARQDKWRVLTADSKLNLELLDFYSLPSRARHEVTPSLKAIAELSCLLHPTVFYTLKTEGLREIVRSPHFVQGAVLFARWRNFPEYYQRLQEGDMTALQEIENTLSLAQQAARMHRGIFEKVDWGEEPKFILTFSLERPSDEVLKTAHYLKDRLADLNLEFSFGLSSGRFYRGLVGAVEEGGKPGEGKIEYGFIGDPGNLSARLASQAEAGQILADDRLLKEVNKVIPSFKALPKVEVKGAGRRLKVVEVYKVEERGGLLEHELEVPLIGREKEKETFRAVIEQLKEGSPQAIIATVADGGYGKSFFADHMINEWHFEKKEVDFLRGYSRTSSSFEPLMPVREIVSQLLELEKAGSPEEILTKVEEALSQAEAGAEKDAPLLAAFLKLAPLGLIESHSFEGASKRVAERLAQIVKSKLAVSQKPLIMVLEDYQWSDSASQELLKELKNATRKLEVKGLAYWLIMRPPEARGENTRLKHFVGPDQALEIDPGLFPKESLAELILAHANIRPIRELLDFEQEGKTVNDINSVSETEKRNSLKAGWRLRELIWRHSDEGNPDRVRSNLRFLIEYPLLYPERAKNNLLEPFPQVDPKEYRIADYIEDSVFDEIESAADLYQRRFRFFNDREQDVLKYAAIIGRDFSLEELQALSGLDLNRIFKVLNRAQESGWLEESAENRYSFVHYHAWRAIDLLTSEIFDEDLRIVRRAETVQAMYAKYLLENHPQRLYEIAHHYIRSDQPEQGFHFSHLAARHAKDTLQSSAGFRQALDFYQQAAELFLKLPLERMLPEEKERFADEIIRIQLEIGEIDLRTRQYEEALAAIEAGKKLFDKFYSPENKKKAALHLASLFILEADTLRWMNKSFEEVMGKAEKAKEMILPVLESAEVALANEEKKELAKHAANSLNSIAMSYRVLKLDFEQSLYYLEIAMPFAELSSDADILDKVRGNRIFSLQDLGRYEEAEKLARLSYAFNKQRDARTAIVTDLRTIASLCLKQDKGLKEAEQLLKEGLLLARDLASPQEGHFYPGLASIYEYKGQYGEAAAIGEEALEYEFSFENRDIKHVGLIRQWIAYDYAKAGFLERAENLAKEVLTMSDLPNSYYASAQRSLALVMAKRGMPFDKAIQQVEKAITLLSVDDEWLPEFLVDKAELELETGDRKAAKATLEEALNVAIRIREKHLEKKARRMLEELGKESLTKSASEE